MDASNSYSLYLVRHVRGFIATEWHSLRSKNKFFERFLDKCLNAALFSRNLAGILNRLSHDIYTTRFFFSLYRSRTCEHARRGQID